MNPSYLLEPLVAVNSVLEYRLSLVYRAENEGTPHYASSTFWPILRERKAVYRKGIVRTSNGLAVNVEDL